MHTSPPQRTSLRCGCPPDAPWPPEPTDTYGLRGPQIEPEAAFWTLCEVPCVIRIKDLAELTDDEDNEQCYLPPYPTDGNVLRAELDELIELASLRDDPDAVYSDEPGRERRGISPFLQLRQQPIGAVVNLEIDPVLGPVRAGRQPQPGAIEIARGDEISPAAPVVRTGRELARYFESETPGLAHRLALNELIHRQNWSPPRQSLVWASLDVAIHSALLAAWYYKWAAHVGVPGVDKRAGVSFRPRPIEVDHRISVLYNRQVNATGSGDDGRRTLPEPSPGTPRHPSYPSGHSTCAGAASELLSYFFPDYTEEFDRLADNAGMARLWAGIHWRSDHTYGVRLGRCVARLVIEQIQRSCICPVDACRPSDNCALPPTKKDLERCRKATWECCKDHHRHKKRDESEDYELDEAEQEYEAEEESPRAEDSQSAAEEISEEDRRAQATGPQGGGTPAPDEAQRRQAAGPQEGGATTSADRRAKEQAEGPQEGA